MNKDAELWFTGFSSFFKELQNPFFKSEKLLIIIYKPIFFKLKNKFIQTKINVIQIKDL